MRPNILIFCTDQQRFDHLGCTSDSVLKTPNIDKIAEGGVCFRSAYSSSPACMPARATMFTGLTPRGNNMRQHGNPLPEDIPTMPGVLAAAGYRTHSVGKLHLKPWAPMFPGYDFDDVETPKTNPERRFLWERHGIKKSPENYYGLQTQDMTIGHGHYATMGGDYAVWLNELDPKASEGYRNGAAPLSIDPELHYNKWIADKSIDFLQEQSEEQPFFLWCSFPDPHTPFAALPEYADMYNLEDMPIPLNVSEYPTAGHCKTLGAIKEGQNHKLEKKNPDKVRQQTQQIFGMMTHIDDQVGRVMETLEKQGLADNTVIVWISDHGEMLGSHGGMHKGLFPYDGSMRVPFIINVPWADSKGRMVNEPVSQIDLVPTILDLCGVDQPEDPRVTEEYKAHLDPMTPPLPGESLKPALLEGAVPLRKNALVEYNQDTFPEYENLQMRTLVTEKYKVSMFSPTREVLLFDRENDPYELQNLADTDEGRKVLPELLAQLLDEVNRTEPRMPRRFSGC